MAKKRCAYERLIPTETIPYWLFWPSVGVLGFALGETIITWFGEEHYYLTQAAFAALMGFVPMATVYLSKSFGRSMKKAAPILWDSEQEFAVWLDDRETRVFTYESWLARLAPILVVVSATITVILSGFPFHSNALNIIAMVGFLPLAGIHGHAAYMIIALLFTLGELADRSVEVPFFRLPHPAIEGLHRFYSIATLAVTIGFVFIILSVLRGPYGVSRHMQLWLSFAAFYPLSMFVWSFYQVHLLAKNAKQSNIEIVNQEVQRILSRVVDGDSAADVERLDRLIDIQLRVQRIKEWPIELQGVFTFLVTSTTAIVQVVLLLRDMP